MPKRPNFFIVGAPKCGTTALSEYLKTHPNVYFSPIKEPHYFAEDFRQGTYSLNNYWVKPVETLQEYLKLFQDVHKQHKAIGEASTTYLWSSVAVEKIYQFNPEAKIIVMIRNPVDLVYSLHSHLLFILAENERNFEKAWKLQEARQQRIHIPNSCSNTNFLQYRSFGQIGSQLERLLEIFPANQIKIIVFDDFIKSTKDVYEDILSFLELPTDGKKVFPKVNSSKSHNFFWVALIAKKISNPPNIIKKILEQIKAIIKVESFGFAGKIIKINCHKRKTPHLEPALKQELILEFQSEVKKVEKQNIGS